MPASTAGYSLILTKEERWVCLCFNQCVCPSIKPSPQTDYRGPGGGGRGHAADERASFAKFVVAGAGL